MPIRGGVRQRSKRGRPAPVDAASEASSRGKIRTFSAGGKQKKAKGIAWFLKQMFVVGRISAPEVQEGAQAHVESVAGEPDAETRSLSVVGNSGKQRGNCSRDLVHKLGKKSHMPPIYKAKICFWDPDRCEQKWAWAHFLLPHEVLDAEIRRSSLTEWLGFEENDALAKTFADWKNRNGIFDNIQNFLAVGIWGDGARFHTRDQLLVLLFNVAGRNLHLIRYCRARRPCSLVPGPWPLVPSP